MLLGRRPLILVVSAGLPRRSVAQCRVKAFGIIVELDIACHVFAGVFTRWIHGPVDPLNLKRRVERFSLGVIETRSHSANRMTYIELRGDLDERLAEILGAMPLS